MRWATMGIGAVALAGCATTAPREPVETVTLTPQQVVVVHEGVRRSLKDPESARFGSMVASRSANGTINVCGWVNARHGYGGYTGERAYSGAMAEGVFVAGWISASAHEDQGVAGNCRSYGINLDRGP